MAKKGKPKKIATAWGVLAAIGDLATRLSSAHKALRKMGDRPSVPLFESITVGSFVVGGMAMALSAMEEALDLLQEVAPCIGDVKRPFSIELGEWRLFRDDASHIMDRTFREPLKSRGDHDSYVYDAEFGDGTLVVGYDFADDALITGNHKLPLGSSVERAMEIYGFVSQIVNDETRKGNIPMPVSDKGLAAQ